MHQVNELLDQEQLMQNDAFGRLQDGGPETSNPFIIDELEPAMVFHILTSNRFVIFIDCGF